MNEQEMTAVISRLQIVQDDGMSWSREPYERGYTYLKELGCWMAPRRWTSDGYPLNIDYSQGL